MLYELPWNDEVMGKIVKYVTSPFNYAEYGPASAETLLLEGGGYVSWYADKGRIMGSNCGVRTFGMMYWRPSLGWTLTPEMRSRIFGIIGWLPMCTNPTNYPYAKFTSLADGSMGMVSGVHDGKKALEELKKWGWCGRKIPTAAHYWDERYHIYYLWRFMDRNDVYTLRGLRNPKDERGKSILKFRDWVDSISTENPIEWKPKDR